MREAKTQEGTSSVPRSFRPPTSQARECPVRNPSLSSNKVTAACSKSRSRLAEQLRIERQVGLGSHLQLTFIHYRNDRKPRIRNEAPRPEAEVSGRPPRGGRLREVAPVGGVDVSKAFSLVSTSPEVALLVANIQRRRFVDLHGRKHTGSHEALRVALPEAVDLGRY